MARSILLLLTGAITGSAAVYLVAAPDPDERTPTAVPQPLQAPQPDAVEPSAAARATSQPATSSTGFAAQRVAVYERVAAVDDIATLEAAIRRVASDGESRLRDMELEVLLARLAEIDPAAAVSLARGLYLEARFLEPLFESWAAADAAAAIRGLAVVQPPARQRRLALAVLRALGGGADRFEQVAAALPAGDRFSFEIDALVDQAERDPMGALQSALAKPLGTLERFALQQLVRRTAEIDPRGTLTQIAGLDDALMRTSFMNIAFGAWAETDPAAVFDWIETVGTDELPESIAVYEALAGLDRGRLLNLLDELPLAVRSAALRGVVQSASRSDPAAAVAMLEELQLQGPERDMLLQNIGRSWGEQNPELAIAWARSLSPPSQTALTSVLQGVAVVDLDRAIDLVLAELDRAPPVGGSFASGVGSLPMILALSSLGANDADFGRLLDRLVERNDPQTRALLSSTMSGWARNQPEAALNWTLANAERLDPNAFAQIGQQLAQGDIELAVATLQRLSPEQQAGWLQGVAGQLAQTDIDRAVGLLAQYRGQPGYAGAYRTVVTQLARSDPEAAASMLQNAPQDATPGPVLMSASSIVAREWARRDPAAAASWALLQTDPGSRTGPIGAVAQTWAQSDTRAARQWLSTLNGGPVRDAALDGYLSATAQLGEFDPTLIDAYSSSEAGQRGAMSAIVQIGRSDPDEANRLLDAYISDDTMRRQAQEQIERINALSGGNIIVSSGGLIFR